MCVQVWQTWQRPAVLIRHALVTIETDTGVTISPWHLVPNFKAWERSPFTKGKCTPILGKGERDTAVLKGCRQNNLSKYHRVGGNITTYFSSCLYKSVFDSNFISASCAFPTLSSSHWECSQLSQSKVKSTEDGLEMSQRIFQRREQHKKSFFAQRAAEERKKPPCTGGRSQKVQPEKKNGKGVSINI